MTFSKTLNKDKTVTDKEKDPNFLTFVLKRPFLKRKNAEILLL